MNKEIILMSDILTGWVYSKKCIICGSKAKDEHGEMTHNKGCELSPIVDKLTTIISLSGLSHLSLSFILRLVIFPP